MLTRIFSHSFSFILVIISSLISVAFFTILERKILGYIQIRKGPNKVGFMGILQPFSDAIKLFSKNILSTEMMNTLLSSTSPAIALMLSIAIWPLIPISHQGILDSNLSLLIFFVISSTSVYALLLIGWAANSKYCYLGAIRGVAQMISYEVSLFLILLSSSVLVSSYAFKAFPSFQILIPLMFITSISFGMWLTSCLAETNRSPFDFAEGESELVSGFNVEYMGGYFALIFLAEYLNMTILCFITTLIFIGDLMWISSLLALILFTIMFLWVRGTLPRFRYDFLMLMNWKIFLPLTISFFILISSLMFISL